MKAVEWVRFFTDQRASHGKSVFSVTELANVADASQAVINVQLGRLVRRGLIRRLVPRAIRIAGRDDGRGTGGRDRHRCLRDGCLCPRTVQRAAESLTARSKAARLGGHD